MPLTRINGQWINTDTQKFSDTGAIIDINAPMNSVDSGGDMSWVDTGNGTGYSTPTVPVTPTNPNGVAGYGWTPPPYNPNPPQTGVYQTGSGAPGSSQPYQGSQTQPPAPIAPPIQPVNSPPSDLNTYTDSATGITYIYDNGSTSQAPGWKPVGSGKTPANPNPPGGNGFTDGNGDVWSWDAATGAYVKSGFDSSKVYNPPTTGYQQATLDAAAAQNKAQNDLATAQFDFQKSQVDTQQKQQEFDNSQTQAKAAFDAQQAQITQQYQQGQMSLQQAQLALSQQQQAFSQQQAQDQFTYQKTQDVLAQQYQQSQLALQTAQQAATQSQQAWQQQFDTSQLNQSQSQFTQSQAQQQNQFNTTQANAQADKLAALKANPGSWIQYNAQAGTPPAVQPWMQPLMPQQYQNTQVGAAIPGWNGAVTPQVGANSNQAGMLQPQGQSQQYQQAPAGTGLAGMPDLINPSAQYMARLAPSMRQQYQSYQQAQTGESPEDTQMRLWNMGSGTGANKQLNVQQ